MDKIIDETSGASVSELISLSDYFKVTLDHLLKTDISRMERVSAKDIQFLVLDVDGVMTDGGMYYTESGDEYKKFNVKDGVAMRRLTRTGFQVGIISSGFNNSLIEKRAEHLGIQHVQTGQIPKLDTLNAWLKDLGFAMKEVAFIGDDLNDQAAMESVGVSACPADAMEEIKTIANVVLSKNGGEGCIREFIDLYFSDRIAN